MSVFGDVAKLVGCVTATVAAGPVGLMAGATVLAANAADKIAESKKVNNQQDKSKKS